MAKMKNTLRMIALLLFLAGPVWAGGSLADLNNKILQETDIEQLEIRQENGRIILEGETAALRNKEKAAQIAEDEFNLQVINNITVLPANKTDDDLTMEVVDRIRRRTANANLFDSLSVDTSGGFVILEGKVRNAYVAHEAEKAAAEVAGVRGVENRIDILPVSQADDRLRNAIYRKLRNDDRLFFYFLGARPSIGIIVENGRVTLTGSVDTTGDKVIAGSLIRQMAGILSVENQLRVD